MSMKIILAFLLVASSTASAGMFYDCKDENGKRIFTNIKSNCRTIQKSNYYDEGIKVRKLKQYINTTKLEDIISAYSDNEVSGDELIKNKKVDFTSVASSIVVIKKTAYVFGFEVTINQPVVILDAPLFSTIAAMGIMDDMYKKDIIKMRKGDNILLSCIGVGLDKSGRLPFDIDDPLSLLTKTKILIFRDCRLKSSYILDENSDDFIWK